ncbi:Pycsar system effector family protein [Desulfogranum marinum]|uniref:Pycsar system effector family protein n=1 Tax=Desulfogranum marinum TaxID=453220 RepID=UPI0034DDA30C
MFVAPIAVFLTTCLCSIIFAVLAAQPHSFKRKSTVEDFRNNKANILVFEHFASLTRNEHSKLMSDILQKNERIYKNMTWQIYLLGIVANRKFRLLKISYTAFLVGLTLSTLMLLIVIVVYHTIGLTEIISFVQSRVIPFDPLR